MYESKVVTDFYVKQRQYYQHTATHTATHTLEAQ